MQRKDAKLTTRGKRCVVPCWKASQLGSSKHDAAPGDLITFDTGDGNTRLARVVGRVDAPALRCGAFALTPGSVRDHRPEDCPHKICDVAPTRGWICAVMLSDHMHHAYEVWVDPEWVSHVEAVTPGHVQFWTTMLTADPQDLMRMSEYGSLSARGTCTLPPPAPKEES